MLCDEFTRDWKVEKSDSLRFSPGACLIIEKHYSIGKQNVSFTIFLEILVSSPNWLLKFGFLGPCYLLMIQTKWNHRKVSFTVEKVE